MRIYLIRYKTSDHGTQGVLIAPEFKCYTLELPWRNNIRNISCIPEGRYVLRLRESRRFGMSYELLNVMGRSHILIHRGNFAGVRTLNYRSDVEGCILLGDKFGVLAGQLAVLNSTKTVDKFMRHIQGEQCDLDIMNNWGLK